MPPVVDLGEEISSSLTSESTEERDEVSEEDMVDSARRFESTTEIEYR